MARLKKDGKFLNCYLSEELFDKLETYVCKTKFTKTAVVEIALKEYFDREEGKKDGKNN